MRYVNWGDVICVLGSNPQDTELFTVWRRREGLREVKRRMDACRVDDGPAGDPTWLVTEEEIQNGRGPCSKPGDWPRCAMWPCPDEAAIYVRFQVGAARVFPHIVDAVRADQGLVRDWHRSLLANARADLPAAEFDALPDEARAVAMTARRTLRRLPHMSFAEAKAGSEAWHREEAERRRQYQANYAHLNLAMHLALFGDAPPLSLAPAVGEGERHPVDGLPNHYWCRLETVEAYRQESARMDHCVGWESQDYAERYLGKAYPEGIWSLRCGDQSLLTAEIVLVDSDSDIGGRRHVLIVQVRAAHNHPIPPKYEVAVLWLESLRVAPTSVGRAA